MYTYAHKMYIQKKKQRETTTRTSKFKKYLIRTRDDIRFNFFTFFGIFLLANRFVYTIEYMEEKTEKERNCRKCC